MRLLELLVLLIEIAFEDLPERTKQLLKDMVSCIVVFLICFEAIRLTLSLIAFLASRLGS